MCVKVDNFLGCVSLENFGLIYGCLHLVNLLISAGSLCVLNPYLFFNGSCEFSSTFAACEFILFASSCLVDCRQHFLGGGVVHSLRLRRVHSWSNSG